MSPSLSPCQWPSQAPAPNAPHPCPASYPCQALLACFGPAVLHLQPSISLAHYHFFTWTYRIFGLRQGTRGKFFTKGKISHTAWKLPCPLHHAAQNDAENVVLLLHEYDASAGATEWVQWLERGRMNAAQIECNCIHVNFAIARRWLSKCGQINGVHNARVCENVLFKC